MPKEMKVKVCGMRDSSNIQSILLLDFDYIGFIFYSKSKRYVLPSTQLSFTHLKTKKVGVFVNMPVEEVQTITKRQGIQIVQLHGSESPEYCEKLKDRGFEVWKALSINDSTDFAQQKSYENKIDHFLFDTKSKQYGGSGKAFDWRLLNSYQGQTSYLLSGGIGLDNLQSAMEIMDDRLIGLDLNSRFEISPGLKDFETLKNALKIIKHE